MTARGLAVSAVWFMVLTLCWPSVSAVVNLGLHDERYLPVLIAPLLFAIVMYSERKRIFAQAEWDIRNGILLLALTLPASVFLSRRLFPIDFAVLTAILAGTAAFLLCYGSRSLVAAVFPFCCLLLMIPVPAAAMDQFNAALQHGSAAVSCEIMRLAGIPVFAHGTELSLPGLNIDVEPECSGIHSCLALALVGALASRIYLRSNWNRFALVVSTIPIAIFKNAIRISVIASLTAYVSPRFIDSPIHHRWGGWVFTPLGVGLFLVLMSLLKKLETRGEKRRRPGVLPSSVTAVKTA